MAQKVILIVDDENELINIYTEVLSSLPNLRIVTAVDGMEAYRKARNQKFDLIISDYKMPKLNGVQLILALRDNNINDQTPIIVVSGYPENVKDELRESRLDKNISIFSKPVDFNFILKLVNEMLFLKPQINKKTVDVDFLNPFLNSVQLVIKEMGQISNVKFGKINSSSVNISLETEISSFLSVVSPNFSGSFILTFPKKTFLNLASKVLDEKFLEISEANEDFAGELSNIILGKTKRLWVDKGFEVEKAIPTIQTGVKFSLHSGENIPNIIIPFESDFGPFYAVISILWN